MSLQQRAYLGMGWSGFSGLISNGLELLKYIVLARILNPSDFGLLAMTMVIIGICRIFSDGGTSNAVIHFRNQSNRQLATLYWINILAGTTLFLLVVILAPFFAAFYHQPEVSRLLRLAALILPIYAAGALFEVLLRKSLLFKKISISESSAALAGFIVAIVLAIDGRGVYALIWSHIVTACVMSLACAILARSLWKPAFIFKPGEVWQHIRFGLFQMGDRGLNVYSTRIDQLIIGRFFGPEILGAYHIAWHTILFPLLRLSPLLNRVALPVFAGRQDNNTILRNGYLKLMNGIISIGVPFFLVAAITSPWLIPVLFGGGWDLTIQFLPIMALLGIIRLLGNPVSNIVLSKGKADLLFYWNSGVAVLNTAIFLIGAQYSVFVLLWLYIALNVLYFITGQWLMVHRLIGLTWGQWSRSIVPFLAAMLIPWLGAWLFRNRASGIWHSDFFREDSGLLFQAVDHLQAAWHNTALWYEQALWGNTVMLVVIATLFIILYIPVFWYFQSRLIREFTGALFRSETET